VSRRQIDLFWTLQLVIGAVLVALAITATSAAAQQDTRRPRTVTIKMENFKFVPSNVTVVPGDTVRWVNTTDTPHDVEFANEPAGGRLSSRSFPTIMAASRAAFDAKGPPPEMSPFLVSKGATYQLVIDPRYFPSGTYSYLCVPHQSFGMKGTIVVTGEEPAAVSAQNH